MLYRPLNVICKLYVYVEGMDLAHVKCTCKLFRLNSVNFIQAIGVGILILKPEVFEGFN